MRSYGCGDRQMVLPITCNVFLESAGPFPNSFNGQLPRWFCVPHHLLLQVNSTVQGGLSTPSSGGEKRYSTVQCNVGVQDPGLYLYLAVTNIPTGSAFSCSVVLTCPQTLGTIIFSVLSQCTFSVFFIKATVCLTQQ